MFTMTEVKVIMLVCNGLSNEEIGNVLDMTEGTVKNHLTSIYAKCNVQNRQELINIFRQRS